MTDQEKSSRGKGRPTLSRKEAEAARRRPLIPEDRKAAKAQAKARSQQRRNEAYEREREALRTGDERYLPARDKGKIRRYIRNYLDARWSVSEFLLPAMLLFLAGMLTVSFLPMNPKVGEYLILALTGIFYGLLAASVIEATIVWRKLKKKIQKKFPGEEIPRGTWFYTYSRMLMARRWRSPNVQVKRGEFPD